MSLSVTRHLFWSPPHVERAVLLAAAAAMRGGPYIEGHHYRLVTREAGSEQRDLPIWTTEPGVVSFANEGWGPVQRMDVDNVTL